MSRTLPVILGGCAATVLVVAAIGIDAGAPRGPGDQITLAGVLEPVTDGFQVIRQQVVALADGIDDGDDGDDGEAAAQPATPSATPAPIAAATPRATPSPGPTDPPAPTDPPTDEIVAADSPPAVPDPPVAVPAPDPPAPPDEADTPAPRPNPRPTEPTAPQPDPPTIRPDPRTPPPEPTPTAEPTTPPPTPTAGPTSPPPTPEPTVAPEPINDKPTAEITAPASGAQVPAGPVAVAGVARDDDGVAAVEVRVIGAHGGGPDAWVPAVLADAGATGTTFATTIDLSATPPGTHVQVHVRAIDVDGRRGNAEVVGVTVVGTGPRTGDALPGAARATAVAPPSPAAPTAAPTTSPTPPVDPPDPRLVRAWSVPWATP